MMFDGFIITVDDRAGNRQRMCFTDSVRDLGEQTVHRLCIWELLSQAVFF